MFLRSWAAIIAFLAFLVIFVLGGTKSCGGHAFFYLFESKWLVDLVLTILILFFLFLGSKSNRY